MRAASVGASPFTMWPRKLGSSQVADLLEVAGAGLGELAGDAADLHHRHAERVGEHDRHLQDDAQLLADVDRGELLEALGAVAGLQQEGVAGGHLAERGLQRPGLAGEHQRGIGGDLLQRPIEVGLVGPLGLLLGREGLPRRRGPRFCHAAMPNGCTCRGVPGRKRRTPWHRRPRRSRCAAGRADWVRRRGCGRRPRAGRPRPG